MDNTEPPNVLKLLPGTAKPDASAEALRSVIADLESGVMAKRLDVFARMTRTKFLALVRAGFTEVQALYLIGVSPF